MNNIEQERIKYANSKHISALDVKEFLVSIEVQPMEMKSYVETFIEMQKSNSNEFSNFDEKARQWYSKLISFVHEYKERKYQKELMSKLNQFEDDIHQYTSNDNVINHFRKGYKLVWLSFSNDEKNTIVRNSEFQYPSKNQKIKTDIQKKHSKIIESRKKESKTDDFSLFDIEENNPNETVIDYAKKNGGTVIDDIDEIDFDSLFDDKK